MASGEVESMNGFARAVDVADGTIFIGEPANAHQPGMVYLYRRSGDEWSQQSKLKASDGEIGDGFGASVFASGQYLLVGAPRREHSHGATYLFERSGDSWSQSARIALSDTTEGSFGASVAMAGDRVFIGAPGEKDGLGAVYVFSKSGDGSWTRQARIANPDTAQGTNFGSSLTFDGSQLYVGAPRHNGGAVYVYNSDNMGSWKKQAALTSGRVDDEGRFGSTITIRGNMALVGAPRQNSGFGSVFVFKNNDGWKITGQLVAFDSAPRHGFGSAMAFVGKDVLVGAPGADQRKGAIYEFNWDENSKNWSGVTKLGGPKRKMGDRFAATLAVDDGIAVSGLVGADFGAGTAAVMEQGDQGWSVSEIVLSSGGDVLEPITGSKTKCSDGKASIFGCSNVNLLSFMPIDKIGGSRGVRLNDIWGWTDPKTDKEYALVGRMDGTSVVDVSNPGNPVYIGNMPKPDSAHTSVWRDIKVYKNHAYVVSDNAGMHGMQVFDLTKVRDFNGDPITFKQAANYDKIHSAHNVVINEDSGFAYIVGSSGGGKTCGGGLHMVNIQDPENPTFAGCFADPSTGRSGTGYTHDAQCVNYHGPDKQYQGHEICVGSNETAISIADVTDKEHPRAISTASYPDHAYVHQGWFTENQRYFFQNDELDELTGNVDHTRTLVWDLTDLDDPQFVQGYLLDNESTDHNLYIKGDTMYESNYVSGLQVIDVSDPANPVQKGYFDTEPFGEDKPGFAGTWSNYPFFDSGIVIMTSSQEGLFILENQEQEL